MPVHTEVILVPQKQKQKNIIMIYPQDYEQPI